MKTLSIVVFLDGRPGHEKQTMGILQALSAITPLEVIDKKVVGISASSTAKNWINYLLTAFLPFTGQKNKYPVDIIIGTGTHTHIPMLLFKRACKSTGVADPKIVTCMTPEELLLNKIDLCCVPQHDMPVQGDNIFVTWGPPNNVTFSINHEPDKGLILLGGVDSKSHDWNNQSIVKKISKIIQKDPAMSWTISSSPRTPDDTCQLLENLPEEMENVSFFRSTETPTGWVEDQYALNSMVWVTGDSMSMIYESLTAGCSVGILPVKWKQQQNKFQKSIDRLVENKMVVEYEKWQSGAELPAYTQEPLNESRRCTEEILRRWWPDRLP